MFAIDPPPLQVAPAREIVHELAERGVLRSKPGAYTSTAEAAEASVHATLQATIAARRSASARSKTHVRSRRGVGYHRLDQRHSSYNMLGGAVVMLVSPEVLLNRLIAELQRAAEDDVLPDEERSELQRTAAILRTSAWPLALNALGGAGGNILSGS